MIKATYLNINNNSSVTQIGGGNNFFLATQKIKQLKLFKEKIKHLNLLGLIVLL